MTRSRRKQASFGRNNPSHSQRNRGGGLEETGTGYRYEDEGSERPQFRGRRSRYGESRGYGSEYEGESRFGGREYEGPRDVEQPDWYQGFPQPRGRGGRDWEQGRQREYLEGDEESRFGRGRRPYGYGQEDYETGMQGLSGHEPGDYSYSGQGDIWRFGSRQRQEWPRGISRSGVTSQSYPSRFDQRRQWSTQGRFAGIGPQGYKRSDERIMEDVNEMLTEAPDLDPSNITVEVHNGEVTLKGTVSDREDKRQAEDIAESCAGVKEVQNQLRVKREEEPESKREKGEEKTRSTRQQIAS